MVGVTFLGVMGVGAVCCGCRCCPVLPHGAVSGTALMLVAQMMRVLMQQVTLKLVRYDDRLLGATALTSSSQTRSCSALYSCIVRFIAPSCRNWPWTTA
jgi:hypothetical protein